MKIIDTHFIENLFNPVITEYYAHNRFPKLLTVPYASSAASTYKPTVTDIRGTTFYSYDLLDCRKKEGHSFYAIS